LKFPVVIAGGGPAGAATATLLADAGRAVVLFERNAAATDKICGEFLSGEACCHLAALGVDLPALGAQPIQAVRLVRGSRVIEAELPFRAFGLSRRVLDEALLACAAAAGAVLRRGSAIVEAAPDASGAMVLTLAHGAICRAGTLFLATGKQDLRGVRRPAPARPDDMVGFKQHYRLAPAQHEALRRHVEIMLFPAGYAGLQLVESGRANLCLLVRRAQLDRVGGGWEALLHDLRRSSPHLDARLDGAVAQYERPLTISRVPYGFLHAAAAADPAGLWRLGDQAAVIPSFTGDGMAIALHSAALAARMFLAGLPVQAYRRRLRADIGGPVRRATALYRLGRSGAGQAAIMAAASVFPPALRLAAALTRVPEAASARIAALGGGPAG
jgi:flavin-dependent dehydrogenase